MDAIGKKGMDASQMFAYISAVIVVALVLILGFNAIQKFLSSTEDIGQATFVNDLSTAIKKTSLEFGSVRQISLPLPSKYHKVCIVDVTSYDSNCKDTLPSTLCDSWSESASTVAGTQFAKKNIFFITDKNTVGFDYYIEDIRVLAPYFVCTAASPVKFRIEGIRRASLVSIS